MIVLVSLIVYIAKKTSCFRYFSQGASLHHCLFSRMIFHLFHVFCDRSRDVDLMSTAWVFYHTL